MKALFLVGSPFQCLCAFEAVHHYKISDAVFEIVSGDNTERDHQIINLLEHKGYKYHKSNHRFPILSQSVARIQNLYFSYIRPLIFHKSIYDYLFVGDYRFGVDTAIQHLCEVKIGGKAVFLDDGAGTISVVKGLYKPSDPVMRVRKHYYRLCEKNKIQTNIFFTIFDNLKSDIFTLDKNQFESLHSETKGPRRHTYIIGTFTEKYCRHQGFPLDMFLLQFSNICRTLVETVPGEVFFIPHGRDKEKALAQICDNHQVIYTRIDTCVEDYLYSNNANPCLIIGYGSTALYSLKKMYPNATVINILNNGSEKGAVETYREIAEEYQLSGIHIVSTPEQFIEYISNR